MYLVDTNVWLERLLNQEKSEEVGQFLYHIPSEHLCITDFAFHSIAILLSKLRRSEALLSFVQDVFVSAGVSLVRLEPEDFQEVISAMAKFHLDFDDAYQYVAASKYNLTLVSLDADFDRTDRGRKLPGEILRPRQE